MDSLKRINMELNAILSKVEKFKNIDLLVGISARNEETTIIHVLNQVGQGLKQFFPAMNSLVVVADGHSNDRTVELAQIFPMPDDIKKIVVPEVEPLGKGSAVKTIFSIAEKVNADATVLIDGDLLSLSPEWIQSLGKEPLFGRNDLVVPYYIRHKYDGVITNVLAYPFTAALYNTKIRQPIGGEYGLSRDLVRELNRHEKFPYHFGIDIFITSVSIAMGFDIGEAVLGLKLHDSTTKYVDPKKHLNPMFNQVVGTMFDVAHHYENIWRNLKREPIKIERLKLHGYSPIPVNISPEKVLDAYMESCKEHRYVVKEIIKDRNLTRSVLCNPKGIKEKEWAKTVMTFYEHYKTNKKEEVLSALRSLWYGRFYDYMIQVKDLSTEEAEIYVREQAKAFQEAIS
ncbi:MAG: glycosyltransferase [Candidatus Hydrothermarchaeota archaeon]